MKRKSPCVLLRSDFDSIWQCYGRGYSYGLKLWGRPMAVHRQGEGGSDRQRLPQSSEATVRRSSRCCGSIGEAVPTVCDFCWTLGTVWWTRLHMGSSRGTER